MEAELTPAALRQGSLPAAIQRQFDRLSAETGVAVAMRSDRDLPPLGMATDVVLLRAAQEAFANIRKHAQASTVTVELSTHDQSVRLSVADNGVGLGDKSIEGFGLRGMRALRAVEAGAAGYLLKDASRSELAEAVRDAARGKAVLAPTVADRLVRFVRQPASVTLSTREVEVLSQVAKGRTNAPQNLTQDLCPPWSDNVAHRAVAQ